MHIQLPQGGGDGAEARREYALSAFRHKGRAEDGGPSADGGCHYNVRLQPQDGAVAPGGETFCGKLLCSADGTRYTFCDDPSNFYSWPRELGAVVVSEENLVVLLPRVHPSGAAAQFRVLKQEDSIIARFFAGQARQHLSLLSGPWATKRSGGEVQLALLSKASSSGRGDNQRDDVVFRAREVQGTLTISFCHPLSAYQAFCLLTRTRALTLTLTLTRTRTLTLTLTLTLTVTLTPTLTLTLTLTRLGRRPRDAPVPCRSDGSALVRHARLW